MSRDINALVPAVREKLMRLQAMAEEQGIEFIVVYTLRTEAEQHALFAQGRKTVEEVNRLRKEAGLAPIMDGQNRLVTKLLTSVHMFGCAFDVAVLKDGKTDWHNTPAYERLGAIGESRAVLFQGLGAFRVHGGLSLQELQAGKRPTV